MTVITKAALICDILHDVKDIACDAKNIAAITCDLQHDCNPCNINADLKCDIQQLECLYHCSYSVPV